MLVLWLANEDFPNKEKDLPWVVIMLMKKGLLVKWHSNLRSYLKLIPSLKEYPNDIIVTADDDVYYPYNWVEVLYISYLKKPNSIQCHRAHKIKFDLSKTVLPYLEWEFFTKQVSTSYLNFLTGHGGVLYPPFSLYKDVLKGEIFMNLSPSGDDIWFWAMAVLNGTKITIPEGHICLFKTIGGTQETSLYYENWDSGKYDQQISAVFKAYPQLNEVILNEIVNV